MKKDIIANLVINVIVVVSLVYIGLVYGPFLFQEARYYTRLAFGKSYVVADDMSSGPTPAGTVASSIFQGVPEIAIDPKSTDFGLIIEKIGVNEAVVADVNASDKNAYKEALKYGVAHAKGTKYPGEYGNVYLFSHSTANVWDVLRYKSYFTLLRKLEAGDRIVMHYKGDRFDYTVYEKRVTIPSDTSDLTGHADFAMLTLQTCEPPGSDAKRLIVKAKLTGYKLAD